MAARQPDVLFPVLLICAGLAFGSYVYFSAPQKGLQQKLSVALDNHKDALITRRAQLVYRDAYGNSQMKRWNAEVEHFLSTVLTPALSTRERNALSTRKAALAAYIEQKVSEYSAETPPLQQFSDAMTPSRYEVFCAEELKRHGWDAAVTKGSRDQGVDVVASKASIRIVLQCKLYNQPVGNKAVQEVVAARNYERAQFGIVVSNNSYTAPARALAASNKVYLLHHRELANLDVFLRSASA